MFHRPTKTCLEQVLAQIMTLSQQIQHVTDLDEAGTTTTTGIRAILDSDRLLVYQFLPNGDGVIMAEAVRHNWQSIQGQLIYDPCFQTKWHQLYQQGHISAISDRETANLVPCHRQLLTRLQVRANLVVPILLPWEEKLPEEKMPLPQLWGLLIAHQCDSPRQWHPLEVEVLRYFATQLAARIPPLSSHPSSLPATAPPNPESFTPPMEPPLQAHGTTSPPVNLTTTHAPVAICTCDETVSLATFDLLQNPVWVYDIERLAMRWANRASLHLWNASSREELLSRDFSDVSESTRIRLQNYLQQFKQGKTVVDQWTFYPRGEPVSVMCRCSGIAMEAGRLVMLVEGSTETAYQLAQETLRAIEALRHTSVMISLYTLEGVPLLQNPAALRCYGDTTHPQMGQENAFLRHFVDPEIGQRAMTVLEAGGIFSIETQIFTRLGVRWHGIDARRVNDPVTGKTTILVNEKDITAQHKALQARLRAETELEAQQAFLRQIIDTVPSCIYVKDKEGKLLVVNQASTEIHGSSVEAMLGKREPDFNPNFSQEQLQQFLAANQTIMESRQAQQEIQQITTATGELRWYHTIVRPWIDANDQVQGIIGNSVDITELKQVEIQLAAEFESKNALLHALQESEDRYRSVVNVLAEGIVLQQTDGQIIACNKSAEKILGLSQAEMVGLTSLDRHWQTIQADGSPFPGETHPAMVTLRTGEAQSNVVMGIHKPDTYLTWISINSQPLLKPGETVPYAVVTSFVDITVQRQAEMSLHHQAERERMTYAIAQHIRASLDLDAILNTTVTEVRHFLQCDRVIIYRFNPDWSGIVVTESVAPGWQSILNLEITDSYFVEHHEQAYVNRSIQARDNIYTAGLSQCHIELLEMLQVKAKLVVPIWQGTLLWGLLVVHQCQAPRHWQPLERELLLQLATQLTIAIQQSELYRQVQHWNTHLECQVQERTAQLQQALDFEALLKRITDKVRDSLDEQEILRSAVQELAQGVGTICCNTGIYNTDQTTTIAYEAGQSLASEQGKTFDIASTPHADVYELLLQGQVCQFCDVTPHPSPDKQNLLTVLACPLMDDQGVLGDLWLFKPAAVAFNDQEVRLVQQVANQCAIALRQSRLYRAAQTQVEELARLNQLKDDFLSTVSHELKTPMSSMKMALQMLEICLRPLGVFEADTNPINNYFQVLQTECEREITLITDLLDLTRLDSGADPLNLSPIHLQFWLPHVSEPFVQRTYQQEQLLEVLIPEDLPPLTTDLTYLERALTELLHNAFKYTPPGGTITVSAHLKTPPSNDFLIITVSNSGVEIPAVERDRIFDKFYRIPNNDPWKHGGTGLGLSLVKKLVQRLGGEIWVESANQRTHFTMQFPLVPQDAVE